MMLRWGCCCIATWCISGVVIQQDKELKQFIVLNKDNQHSICRFQVLCVCERELEDDGGEEPRA